MTTDSVEVEVLTSQTITPTPLSFSSLPTLDPPPEIKQDKVKEFINVDAVTADLLAESVRLHIGKDFYKYISYPDFVITLQGLLEKEVVDKDKQQYWFPPGLFYFAKGAGIIELTFYYPECIQDIIYGDTKRKSVVPNILISHSMKLKGSNEYTLNDTKYLCTHKSIEQLPRKFYWEPDSRIFTTIPFTNTYGDGKLCYGYNSRPSSITPPDFRPLHWYYHMLFTTPFNNDLGIPGIRSGSPYRSSFGSWYKHLAKLAEEKKPFPYTELNLIIT